MINPNDENLRWTDRADMEMALISMIELLYKGELIENYSEEGRRFLLFDSSALLYKGFYKNYKELLNIIVEIFFPALNFTPSNINKKGEDEFYMFEVINAIFSIVWYNKIEKSRPRGYEKTLKELDNALYYLYGYANCKKIDKLIDFPAHQNETIQQIEDMFKEINRSQQGKKIVNSIKKYFGIEKVTSTKNKMMINNNKRIQEEIKEDHNLTDEELHKIPIIGQLQTKL